MINKTRGATRKAILNLATELMQGYGYHGFSYHHIGTRLGIRSAAVHYHFPAKADLGVAVLARFREDFDWWCRQLSHRRAGGTVRIRAYLDLFRPYVGERKVCPLGIVAVEHAGLPESMRAEGVALLEEVHSFLSAALADARDDGSVAFSGDAHRLALQVQATAQGALQLGRMQGRRGFEQAVESLWESLGQEPHPARIA